MREFKAKKGNFWIYIVLSILFPVYVGSTTDIPEKLWICLPAFLPFVLFIWAYFSTKYFIKEDYFHYQSAFLRGRIEISKITSIQQNKILWSGIKPALATKGMIIKYGYDEVYVAPINNQELIEALLEINDTIIVT